MSKYSCIEEWEKRYCLKLQINQGARYLVNQGDRYLELNTTVPLVLIQRTWPLGFINVRGPLVLADEFHDSDDLGDAVDISGGFNGSGGFLFC